MDSGDDCTTRWMYLMSLNCTLINGPDGRFYVMCFWPPFSKGEGLKGKPAVAPPLQSSSNYQVQPGQSGTSKIQKWIDPGPGRFQQAASRSSVEPSAFLLFKLVEWDFFYLSVKVSQVKVSQHTVLSMCSLWCCNDFFFFFFGCLMAYGVPRPGIKSDLQLWLMPQLWRHQTH